jgi:hypothetical protein
MNKPSAHEAITQLLNGKLQKRLQEKLDKATCTEIYQDVFFTLSEVVKEAGTPLSNESVNLLAQLYYDSITVNGGQELDPNIFTQRAKLENIPTKEIALLATMFRDSPFDVIFLSAMKRRS